MVAGLGVPIFRVFMVGIISGHTSNSLWKLPLLVLCVLIAYMINHFLNITILK